MNFVRESARDSEAKSTSENDSKPESEFDPASETETDFEAFRFPDDCANGSTLKPFSLFALANLSIANHTVCASTAGSKAMI